MSYKRQHPGRREREAGKRHRRTIVTFWDGSKWVSLKLGRRHSSRWSRHTMSVSESRNTGNKTVKEYPRQPTEFKSQRLTFKPAYAPWYTALRCWGIELDVPYPSITLGLITAIWERGNFIKSFSVSWTHRTD